MKKSVFFILMLLPISIYSQEVTNNKIDLKLYTNFSYIPRYTELDYDSASNLKLSQYEKEVTAFHFSPTIVFHNKKGFSTEIEVSRFRYSSEYIKKYNYNDSTHKVENVLSEGRNKQFELFIRYEYKQTLFAKKEWKRFKPLMGLSATPFVQWTKFEPRISTAYASSKLSVGMFISLIPRIEYTLNDRLYLDLNFPVAVANMHYTTIKQDDPTLTQNERDKSFFSYTNGPFSFAVRFGIGFKIYKSN